MTTTEQRTTANINGLLRFTLPKWTCATSADLFFVVATFLPKITQAGNPANPNPNITQSGNPANPNPNPNPNPNHTTPNGSKAKMKTTE